MADWKDEVILGLKAAIEVLKEDKGLLQARLFKETRRADQNAEVPRALLEKVESLERENKVLAIRCRHIEAGRRVAMDEVEPPWGRNAKVIPGGFRDVRASEQLVFAMNQDGLGWQGPFKRKAVGYQVVAPASLPVADQYASAEAAESEKER